MSTSSQHEYECIITVDEARCVLKYLLLCRSVPATRGYVNMLKFDRNHRVSSSSSVQYKYFTGSAVSFECLCGNLSYIFHTPFYNY